MSPSHQGTQDVSFSPHNDPLDPPTNPDDLNNQVLDESMNTKDPCLEITNNTELLIIETICNDLMVANSEQYCLSIFA
jgi:hypothetical protein